MDLPDNIISKMANITRRLRVEYSSLSFIGLIQRSEIETWDIVIAGDNLSTDQNNTTIAQILSESFLRSEIVLFSGFVVLNSDNQFIQLMKQMNAGLPLDTQPNRIYNSLVGSVLVKNSYIFFA